MYSTSSLQRLDLTRALGCKCQLLARGGKDTTAACLLPRLDALASLKLIVNRLREDDGKHAYVQVDNVGRQQSWRRSALAVTIAIH